MNQLVLVSGAPGAGKTSLAVPLAARLQLPLLSKDIIKEELFDSLGRSDSSLAWSQQLGAASMELMWKLAAYAPAIVLEANFRPHSDYERARISSLSDRVVEVYCECPPEIAARRSRERARTDGHHPVHRRPRAAGGLRVRVRRACRYRTRCRCGHHRARERGYDRR
jgi:predicted kinase